MRTPCCFCLAGGLLVAALTFGNPFLGPRPAIVRDAAPQLRGPRGHADMPTAPGSLAAAASGLAPALVEVAEGGLPLGNAVGPGTTGALPATPDRRAQDMVRTLLFGASPGAFADAAGWSAQPLLMQPASWEPGRAGER